MSLLLLASWLFTSINGAPIDTPEDIGWAFHNDTIEKNLERGHKILKNFATNINGIIFAGPFTDNAVLQRGPELAAVYGAMDTPNGKPIVTLKNEDTKEEFVIYGETFTKPDESYYTNDWKVIFPQAFKNGGNYTLSVECLGCLSNNGQTLHNITFGDVYYCSGQSNMELVMHYTFSRNITYDAIKNGKYKNIRYKTYSGLYAPQISYVTPPLNQPWVYTPDKDTLDQFSSVCWYFAQSMIDVFNKTDITFGLIDTSVGGTMIEQWAQNETMQDSCHDTLCPNPACGSLYNGLVAGLLNMTIKAALWYQGENNNAETPHGSWANATGYGCMEPVMINQWRQEWSVVPNTTNNKFPFGVTEIANGCGEGAPDIETLRWAQASNLGYMPNYVVENTFFANAYDLGDPWYKQCYYENPSNCQPWDAPYSLSATNYYMGPIHPRTKIFVGKRLAQTGYNVLYGNGKSDFLETGPYLKDCKFSKNDGTIVVYYNETFLKGNKVDVTPPNLWYNTSLNDEVINWSGFEINVGTQWFLVNFSDNARESDTSVTLDVSQYSNGSQPITGVRYMWNTVDHHCCGSLNLDFYPCPPVSCSIKTTDPISNIVLPGEPFWARINQTDGTCYCWDPQKCGHQLE